MSDIKLGMTYSQRMRALSALNYYLDLMRTNGYEPDEIAEVEDMLTRLSGTRCGKAGCDYCEDAPREA